MNETGSHKTENWVFGRECSGCGAPEVHFCPLCGADMFESGHGAVPVGDVIYPTLLAVCDGCIDRLNAGEKPPFREPGKGGALSIVEVNTGGEWHPLCIVPGADVREACWAGRTVWRAIRNGSPALRMAVRLVNQSGTVLEAPDDPFRMEGRLS